MTDTLLLIWRMNLFLASLAGLVFLVLVLRRARDEWRVAHYNQTRKLLQDILFRYLVNDETTMRQDLANLLAFRKRYKHELRQLATEMFQLIRGQERDRLTRLLDESGFRADTIKGLSSGSVLDRQQAALALRMFGDVETRQVLLNALDDEDARVRVAAASSLAFVNALPDINYVLDKLAPAVRQQSRDVRALFGEIARQHPKQLLKRAAGTALSRKEKVLLADAMSEASDYQVVTVLNEWALDQDLNVRVTAIRSLGKLQHPAAAAVIKAALGDMHWQVRAAAARAAGRIGLPECIQPLNFLLDDVNWWVRFRAAEALAVLGSDAVGILQVRASYAGCGGFGRGARMAALILSESGDEPAGAGTTQTGAMHV